MGLPFHIILAHLGLWESAVPSSYGPLGDSDQDSPTVQYCLGRSCSPDSGYILSEVSSRKAFKATILYCAAG